MVLMKALIQINKFKLSYNIILKEFQLVKTTIQKNKEMDNTKELYIVLDQILLNLFDLLEVIKKDISILDEER